MSRVAFVAALVLSGSCTSRNARVNTPRPTVAGTLFVTSDLQGYLGPCGCSQNMRGGIDRAAHQVAQARQAGAPVLLVDTGNALFGVSEVPAEAVGEQERKATALSAALKKMGLSLRALGPLDDARGAAFREALALPTLAEGAWQTLDLGGRAVAVISSADAAVVAKRAAEARAAGADFVVALFHQPFDAALRLALSEGLAADLVVATRPKDALSAEQTKSAGSAVKVVQLQSKGRSLLRVDLSFPTTGRVRWLKGAVDQERELAALDARIELVRGQVNQPGLAPPMQTLLAAKLEELMGRRQTLALTPLPRPTDANAATLLPLPLEKSLPGDPAVAAIISAYDAEVGALNLAWSTANGQDCEPPSAERPGFLGNQVCLTCHAQAAASYAASKHARAMESLEHKGKQHHLACIGCHVTGWKQPGGVCRLDVVAGREGVGCESCHGPGSAHAAQPTRDTVRRGNTPQTCTGCHDLENSPHFVYDTWVQRVLGEGHGLPVAADGG